MKYFENLLQKHGIKISDEVKKACIDGLKIMQKSLDYAHDESHLKKIFENLDKFLTEQKEIDINQIDFEVLLLGISWHDTWRTKKMPENIFRLLRDQFYDGIGSKRVFSRYAKENLKDFRKIKEVKHVIAKHAHPTILPPRTIEAWIMKDIDLLEEWSVERIQILEEYSKNKSGIIPPFKLKVAFFYFQNFMLNKSDKDYHFAWTKKEFKSRKLPIITYTLERMKQYGPSVVKDPEKLDLIIKSTEEKASQN